MPNNYCGVPGCSNSDQNAPDDEDLAKEWKSKIEKDVELNGNTLSATDVPSVIQRNSDEKIGLGRERVNCRYTLPDTNLFHLPLDIWENLFDYVSLNDIITLSSVCKHLQQIVQTIKRSFVFSHCYSLNIDCLLNYTLSTTCKSVNLNHCYWLKPNEIMEIISKTRLEHLHLIDCNINEDCTKAICDLSLSSLSITYNIKWLYYLTRNRVFNFNVFKTLTRIKIFFNNIFPVNNIVFEASTKLICYCKQLQYLKVFDSTNETYRNLYPDSDDGPESPKFPLIPLQTTPLPNLKTLIININNESFWPYFSSFIEIILKNKVIPLEYVDFGYLTGYLFKNNILQDQLIKWDKSPLICCPGEENRRDSNFYLDFPQVQNLISQTKCEKITISYCEINRFFAFAQLIVKRSKTSLKEIHIKHNRISNYCDEFLVGLMHIAINCSQITVLDISDLEAGLRVQSDGEDSFYINYVYFQKHEAIIGAFSELRNLKKVILNPFLLHCKFIDSNGEKCTRAIPFWKVTEGCKHLIEIRIVRNPVHPTVLHHVHPDSLFAIALCSKLRSLHLINFRTTSISDANSIITKLIISCEQLQKLTINNLKPFDANCLEENISLAKNLKLISICKSGILNFSKKFITNLSWCKKIEKIRVDLFTIQPEEYEQLTYAFLKLLNLQVVVFAGNSIQKSTIEAVKLILSRIVRERPTFVYGVSREYSLSRHFPAIHYDLLHVTNMCYH